MTEEEYKSMSARLIAAKQCYEERAKVNELLTWVRERPMEVINMKLSNWVSDSLTRHFADEIEQHLQHTINGYDAKIEAI